MVAGNINTEFSLAMTSHLILHFVLPRWTLYSYFVFVFIMLGFQFAVVGYGGAHGGTIESMAADCVTTVLPRPKAEATSFLFAPAIGIAADLSDAVAGLGEIMRVCGRTRMPSLHRRMLHQQNAVSPPAPVSASIVAGAASVCWAEGLI